MMLPEPPHGISSAHAGVDLTGEGQMAVATAIKRWTLEELHSLPDDGNKYELIDGELFVTPAPAPIHELVLARLHRILDAYVAEQGLGHVYRPRAVIRRRPKSEVEPDLFVSQEIRSYDRAPTPSLVVEVMSPYTRRRDLEIKRSYYLVAKRIPEYWVVDTDARTILVARPEAEDTEVESMLTWSPAAARTPLTFDIRPLFD